MVFRKWRTRKDEEIQAQLNALSSRFITQANAILERLEHAAGILFEIPVEHLEIACPLRVESHLYYKVERVFYSLDSSAVKTPPTMPRTGRADQASMAPSCEVAPIIGNTHGSARRVNLSG